MSAETTKNTTWTRTAGSSGLRQRMRCACMEHVAPGVRYCLKSGMECDEQERGGCIEMSRKVRPNAPRSATCPVKGYHE